MSVPGQERWNALWRMVGARAEPSLWYGQLMDRYSQPHRHYHTARHIADCLAEFDPARSLAQNPVVVELAIWFHDAIYDPRAADNEEQSASLAAQCLSAMEVPGNDRAGLTDSVAHLVLATKHHDGSLQPDAPLVVDIDLSILGQPPARFMEYDTQIRMEYAWVPEKIFCEKRAEILERFL
jgi:predicted metal-dependent HD superfamily phosphohydrolase